MFSKRYGTPRQEKVKRPRKAIKTNESRSLCGSKEKGFMEEETMA